MRSIRNIAPYISIVLIVLVLSGTMGFTLTIHTCHHCGMQNVVTSLIAGAADDKCCLGHDDDIAGPGQNAGEYVFSHDCCSIETERMAAAQVILTELQPEIMPCFLTATSLIIIPDHDLLNVRPFTGNMQMHDGRDLMKMHCQILS